MTDFRIIVCGSRDFADRDMVYRTLDAIHAKTPITFLIEGGARGADRLGRWWAISRNVEFKTVEANWDGFGKSAGHIRNGAMLTLDPHLVVAFPGGKGTADMVRQARAKGVEVMEVTG